MTSEMSALTGIGTSTTARAQSFDRLTALMICPFGTVITSPSVLRTRVTRSVTSSTVPSASSEAPVDGDLDGVAEAVLPFGDDEEPGEDVLHDALGTETERGTEHGRRRHQAADRQFEMIEHLQRRDDVDERDQHPRDDLRHRVAMLGGLRPDQVVGLLVALVDTAG